MQTAFFSQASSRFARANLGEDIDINKRDEATAPVLVINADS